MKKLGCETWIGRDSFFRALLGPRWKHHQESSGNLPGSHLHVPGVSISPTWIEPWGVNQFRIVHRSQVVSKAERNRAVWERTG